VGVGYEPLQSVNYHNSHAHGYERFGVLAGLVGFWDGLDWICLVGNRYRVLARWLTLLDLELISHSK
jgi:hypothetical protein